MIFHYSPELGYHLLSTCQGKCATGQGKYPATQEAIHSQANKAIFSDKDWLIEKESQAGLRIGKYGALPNPEGETPSFAIPTRSTIARYTGFQFQEHDSIRASVRAARETTMLDWSWSTVPWYARLLGLLRLPYDLAKFVATGRLILIPWPWRW